MNAKMKKKDEKTKPLKKLKNPTQQQAPTHARAHCCASFSHQANLMETTSRVKVSFQFARDKRQKHSRGELSLELFNLQRWNKFRLSFFFIRRLEMDIRYYSRHCVYLSGSKKDRWKSTWTEFLHKSTITPRYAGNWNSTSGKKLSTRLYWQWIPFVLLWEKESKTKEMRLALIVCKENGISLKSSSQNGFGERLSISLNHYSVIIESQKLSSWHTMGIHNLSRSRRRRTNPLWIILLLERYDGENIIISPRKFYEIQLYLARAFYWKIHFSNEFSIISHSLSRRLRLAEKSFCRERFVSCLPEKHWNPSSFKLQLRRTSRKDSKVLKTNTKHSSNPQAGGDQRLQRRWNWIFLSSKTDWIFSALHSLSIGARPSIA